MTGWMTGRVALLIIAVSALIITLLAWFAFIAPQRSKASDLDVQVAGTETQILDAQNLLRGSTRKQSLAAVRQLQGVMPDQIKMSQLLRQLSGVATTSQIELDTITPTAPTATTGPEAIPIAVQITGHYFAIQRFLRLLRSSADVRNGKLSSTGRLFTVDSIQFTGGAVGGVVTANLKINAFLYSTPTAVTPVTTTPTSTTATAASP
jgi:Tfp pilus assembly protein PilO